jgi:hypothetical protein
MTCNGTPPVTVPPPRPGSSQDVEGCGLIVAWRRASGSPDPLLTGWFTPRPGAVNQAALCGLQQGRRPSANPGASWLSALPRFPRSVSASGPEKFFRCDKGLERFPHFRTFRTAFVMGLHVRVCGRDPAPGDRVRRHPPRHCDTPPMPWPLGYPRAVPGQGAAWRGGWPCGPRWHGGTGLAVGTIRQRGGGSFPWPAIPGNRP